MVEARILDVGGGVVVVDAKMLLEGWWVKVDESCGVEVDGRFDAVWEMMIRSTGTTRQSYIYSARDTGARSTSIATGLRIAQQGQRIHPAAERSTLADEQKLHLAPLAESPC